MLWVYSRKQSHLVRYRHGGIDALYPVMASIAAKDQPQQQGGALAFDHYGAHYKRSAVLYLPIMDQATPKPAPKAAALTQAK
ncbi:MAG: hypothetical protein AB8B77_02025 [Alphaproteobacteria bacterium]